MQTSTFLASPRRDTIKTPNTGPRTGPPRPASRRLPRRGAGMWLLLAAAAALAVAAALGAQHERPTPDTLLSAAPVPATAAAPGAVAAGDTSVPQAGAVFSGQGAAPPVLPTPTF